MSAWWAAIGGVVVMVVLVWVVFVMALWRAQRGRLDRARVRDALRLVPDVIRLLRHLATDRHLPRSLRWRLWLLIGYLVSPIDLVPDVIPVLGYADDAIIVAVALRSIVRRAGADTIRRHWPGTDEGLTLLLSLAGIDARTPTTL